MAMRGQSQVPDRGTDSRSTGLQRHKTRARMLTAQQKADLDNQIAKSQKDMGKARARLGEQRPKVGTTHPLAAFDRQTSMP